MSLQNITDSSFREFDAPAPTGYEVGDQKRDLKPAAVRGQWQIEAFWGGTAKALRVDTDRWQYTSITQSNTELAFRHKREERTVHTGIEISEATGRFAVTSDSTATETENVSVSSLRHAVDSEDIQRFVSLMNLIDWTHQTPETIVIAIKWALEIGAHQTARSLADKGHATYPDHAELARLQRVTAPPKALSRLAHPDTSVRKNQAWLREHAEVYHGYWVALDSGNLVALADTVSELKDGLGELKGYLVTKVR